MKCNFLLALGVVLFVAVSCANRVEPDWAPGVRHSVTLKVSDGGTKAIFDPYGAFHWQTGDKIGVSAVGSTGLGALTLDHTTSGNVVTGTEPVYFNGELDGEIGGYAVYPYSASHRISGQTLTYNLPSSYSYSDVDTDYYTLGTQSYFNSANPPAWGTITSSQDEWTTELKHLCGVLCIRIDKLPANKGYVTLTADRKITGNFTVDLGAETPEITTSTETATADNTVTINYWGVAGASGVFYFPLPVGEYNVTLTLGFQKLPTTVMYSRTTPSRKLEISRRDVRRLSVSYDTMAKKGYHTYDGHKFIDLGLPSGTLWAEINIGASGIYGIGRYYTWGETDIKTFYSDPGSYSKYNSTDKLSTLENKDDAAYVNWGSFCRMPTKAQFDELINSENCTMEGDGRNGVWFRSTRNGTSVFFPYTGYKYNDESISVGAGGYYWSREINTDGYTSAYGLCVHVYDDTIEARTLYDLRWGGYAVRAVVEP
jgi:hypothetical protein